MFQIFGNLDIIMISCTPAFYKLFKCLNDWWCTSAGLESIDKECCNHVFSHSRELPPTIWWSMCKHSYSTGWLDFLNVSHSQRGGVDFIYCCVACLPFEEELFEFHLNPASYFADLENLISNWKKRKKTRYSRNIWAADLCVEIGNLFIMVMELC